MRETVNDEGSPAGLAPAWKVLAAAALFSTGGAAIKSLTLSGLQVAFLRSAVAGVTLFVLLRAGRRWPGWRELLVGLSYAATMILFVVANKLTTSASTIFLQNTSPLYLLLLGPWLLHEPIRRRDYAFLVALGLGLACFFVGLDPTSATAPDPFMGDLLAILSGLTWALTVVGFRFLGKGGGSAGGAAVSGNVIACLVCLPFALPLPAHLLSQPADGLILLYLGVFQLGFAYFFLTRGLEKVPAFEAALLLLLEPVLNPIWSWLIHGERPSRWSFAGGGVILAATLVKSWLDARDNAAARALKV